MAQVSFPPPHPNKGRFNSQRCFPNILPHAGDLTFREELEGLQPAVDSLISLGVNKIVALGHSGYDKALDIANNLEGVDVVVSGRDFTLLYTGNRLWLDRACS